MQCIASVDELIERLRKIRSIHGRNLPIIINGTNVGHSVCVGVNYISLIRPIKQNLPEAIDPNQSCIVLTGT